MAATASDVANWSISLLYETEDCSDAPVFLIATPECVEFLSDEISKCQQDLDEDTSNLGTNASIIRQTHECTSDLSSYVDETFGEQTYVRVDIFSGEDCLEYVVSNAFPVDGLCHSNVVSQAGEVAVAGQINTLHPNESVTRSFYSTGDCSDEPTEVWELNQSSLASGECQQGSIVSTNAGLSEADSGSDSQQANSQGEPGSGSDDPQSSSQGEAGSDGQQASSQGEAGSNSQSTGARAALEVGVVLLLVASLIV